MTQICTANLWVRCSPELIRLIDEARRQLPHMPSRSEFVRMTIAHASAEIIREAENAQPTGV